MSTNLTYVFSWVLHNNVVYVQIIKSFYLIFISTVHIASNSRAMMTRNYSNRITIGGMRLEDFGVSFGWMVVPPCECICGRDALYRTVKMHWLALTTYNIVREIQHADLTSLICWKWCKRNKEELVYFNNDLMNTCTNGNVRLYR